MDRNLLIQYTISGIIIMACIVWLAVRFIRKGKRRGSGSCAGCALSDHCDKPEKHLQNSNKHLKLK